jgi:bifunctional non-homologous end joining protein LigD
MLDDYRRKRDFNTTPEPDSSPIKIKSGNSIFLIHKHHATHLHYDLRIELNGVLKSWAIPKGPSMNPSDKHLAIMVEDHPFDYRNFEGNIPAGNYGAGAVMIWDEGIWTIPDISDKGEAEKILSRQILSGKITIFLSGKKLTGLFHLTRFNRSASATQWLLIKSKDSYSSEQDILAQDRSARSNLTLEQIAQSSEQSKSNQKTLISTDFTSYPSGTFPDSPIIPMLAKSVEIPFNKQGWIFEIKWDGYRAIAEIRPDELRFYSRHGISIINHYPSIEANLSKISSQVILDGEIVALDNKGQPDFNLLQNYIKTQKGTIVYYVFDILYISNHYLFQCPLSKRKIFLHHNIPEFTHIKHSNYIEEYGISFFDAAKANHLEGIVAKDVSSFYYPGLRTDAWQKIKVFKSLDVVIGGFIKTDGYRSGIKSLLAGIIKNGAYIYIGNIGGGFTEDDLRSAKHMLTPLIQNLSPFKNSPDIKHNVVWLKPSLICEITFAEWTPDGLLRQPIFKTFRNDMKPSDLPDTERSPSHKISIKFHQSENETTIVTINQRALGISNKNKIYWPRHQITKGATIDYYRHVAPLILPYLKNYPQSLHRFPNGIDGDNFYQKNIETAPDWLETISIYSESEKSTIRYLLCQNEETLIYMVNLGTIEINPWLSSVRNLDSPDFAVIDLDPFKCSFELVTETAIAFHVLMEKADIVHFIKTSGATGLHIYIPVGAQYTYEQTRKFVELLCLLIYKQKPDITSLARLPSKREGKVYMDYLQNTKGKTMASAYSLRPLPNAPVSTPILWSEVTRELHPDKFTFNNISARLDHYGDLWNTINSNIINMEQCLINLAAIQEK